MRILVTGLQSQLARSLQEKAVEHSDLHVEFVGRPELELSERGRSAALIAERRPDIVINAAAYTMVDQAESEPELAFRINADAAGEMAKAAREIGAKIVQISTDYVFNGEADAPYTEDSPTAPLNVYGRSKLAGEEQVRAANPDHLIVRTSWVHSPFGHNFVRTMLRLAADRDEIRVVADQKGCPTNALDLADALLTAVPRCRNWGATYHVAAPEPCSWADLASAVFQASRERGGPWARIVPISTADYPTPAKRPIHSALDSSRFARDFGIRLPDWRSSLEEVVDRLVAV
jgi:dTDP-4-dehydrorhamnose reductase